MSFVFTACRSFVYAIIKNINHKGGKQNEHYNCYKLGT